MLKEIVIEVLKESDYKFKKSETVSETLHIYLNEGKLKVSVNPTQTFNVNGGTKKEQKELSDFIEKNIRPKVRVEAKKILDKGVQEWNDWRQTHGQLFIDFSKMKFEDLDLSKIELRNADFSYSEFKKVNFQYADLSSCKLVEAQFINCDMEGVNLCFADALMAEFKHSDLNYSKLGNASFAATNLTGSSFEGVELEGVNLKHANLSNTKMNNADLSGAIIDTDTIFNGAEGIKKGINGIWNEDTDSAALYSYSPPGNSMKGPNVEAVLESLRRARKYFGYSFYLSLGGALLVYLKQESATIPFFKEYQISIEQYLQIASVFSLGLIVLSKSFIDDAFEGIKYLEDRYSAMSVGSFPWALTKFAGDKFEQVIISMSSRVLLCLHPVLYLFLFNYSEFNLVSVIFVILALSTGIWVLSFSFNFQKPILFDSKTERKKSKETIISKLDELVKKNDDFGKRNG